MLWECADKKLSKFRDWLDGGSLTEVKPGSTVLEVLGYLAYETVGQVHVCRCLRNTSFD